MTQDIRGGLNIAKRKAMLRAQSLEVAMGQLAKDIGMEREIDHHALLHQAVALNETLSEYLRLKDLDGRMQEVFDFHQKDPGKLSEFANQYLRKGAHNFPPDTGNAGSDRG